MQVYGATYLQKLLEPLLRTVITSPEWQPVSFEVDPTRFDFGIVMGRGGRARGEGGQSFVLFLIFPPLFVFLPGFEVCIIRVLSLDFC